MARASDYIPSHRIRGAVLAERRRIERELERLQARRDHLVIEVATVEAAERDLADQLRALSRLSHDDQPLGVDRQRLRLHTRDHRTGSTTLPGHENGAGTNGHVLLKGSRIRETAVRALASAPEGRYPIHYRDWYALVFRCGFVVGGKNPYASFLTQVSRSPVVERRGEPGHYALDFSAPQRIRQRLSRLMGELDGLHARDRKGDLSQVDALQRTRRELMGAAERMQRDLQEALRSLGEGDGEAPDE